MMKEMISLFRPFRILRASSPSSAWPFGKRQEISPGRAAWAGLGRFLLCAEQIVFFYSLAFSVVELHPRRLLLSITSFTGVPWSCIYEELSE